MTTRATLLAVLCALVAAPGCGDDDGPPSSQQKQTANTEAVDAAPAPVEDLATEDKRGLALRCIRDEKGIDARAIGEKNIQIGAEDVGPSVVFYQSSLEAEAAQFEGRGEGAEQIGAALLFVREAPEDQLEQLEDCLNDQ